MTWPAVGESLLLIGILTLWGHTSMAQVEVHGHRGWRGQYPENTIPGFIAALERGVDVLELDVVMSADLVPIVSHEPWFNQDICSMETVVIGQGNLFRMTAAEIQRIDCGTKVNPQFAGQKPAACSKPTLAEMIKAMETWQEKHSEKQVRYNVEIKYKDAWLGEFMPEISIAADSIMATLHAHGVEDRCVIQSFHPGILRYVRTNYPKMILSYLVGQGRMKKNLMQLGFIPHYYSPKHTLLNAKEMQYAEAAGIKVLPWTVNKGSDIQRMIDLGVAGIISDYPELVMEMLSKQGHVR